MKDQSSDNYLRWAIAQSLKGNPLAAGSDQPPDVYSENGPYYTNRMEGWTPRHILEGRGGGHGDIAAYYLEAPSPMTFGLKAEMLPYYGQPAKGGDFNKEGAFAQAGWTAGGINEQLQRIAETTGMDRYSKEFEERASAVPETYAQLMASKRSPVGPQGVSEESLSKTFNAVMFGGGRRMDGMRMGGMLSGSMANSAKK